MNELSSKISNRELVELTDDIRKERLLTRIKYYLDNDLEKLLRILYRLDIPESQVEHIFSGSKKEDIPSALSDLIINRQLSKAKTREIYRK